MVPVSQIVEIPYLSYALVHTQATNTAYRQYERVTRSRKYFSFGYCSASIVFLGSLHRFSWLLAGGSHMLRMTRRVFRQVV
jgi:hypothetical protein